MGESLQVAPDGTLGTSRTRFSKRKSTFADLFLPVRTHQEQHWFDLLQQPHTRGKKTNFHKMSDDWNQRLRCSWGLPSGSDVWPKHAKQLEDYAKSVTAQFQLRKAREQRVAFQGMSQRGAASASPFAAAPMASLPSPAVEQVPKRARFQSPAHSSQGVQRNAAAARPLDLSTPSAEVRASSAADLASVGSWPTSQPLQPPVSHARGTALHEPASEQTTHLLLPQACADLTLEEQTAGPSIAFSSQQWHLAHAAQPPALQGLSPGPPTGLQACHDQRRNVVPAPPEAVSHPMQHHAPRGMPSAAMHSPANTFTAVLAPAATASRMADDSGRTQSATVAAHPATYASIARQPSHPAAKPAPKAPVLASFRLPTHSASQAPARPSAPASGATGYGCKSCLLYAWRQKKDEARRNRQDPEKVQLATVRYKAPVQGHQGKGPNGCPHRNYIDQATPAEKSAINTFGKDPTNSKRAQGLIS